MRALPAVFYKDVLHLDTIWREPAVVIYPTRVDSVIRGYVYLGAREATIFSKRGSPRNGSQNGSSFNSP